jgi:lysophospholipase L1-like esterase
MAIPTVDEVYADFNLNGTVKEPAKQEIRRLLRFIQGIAATNGMETYVNKTVMDADTTQDDGQAALLYSDPVDANNFPTVWIWDDGGNEWIEGVDRISSLKTLVDLMHVTMRRVVVLNGEIIIDRLNLLGGGAQQIYVPRGVFIDTPGAAASNITAVNADSTEVPGSAKLAVPLSPSLRGFVYLDLADNTIKLAAATGGDFTLPTTNVDKIVPLMTFPNNAGSWWSPYKIRELSPPQTLSPFALLSPIVHDRAANKVLIPSANIRNEGVIFSHTVASSQRYEEFNLASSPTAIVTYWWDFRAGVNLYKATAGGAGPMGVDPTIGVVLGWSWGNEFYSPWPHIGRMGVGAGKNDFAFGKGDRLAQSPFVWDNKPSRQEMVDVVDAALIAAGFTRAIRSVDWALAWPYIGDKLADNRAGKPFFARVWLEAAEDNEFGAPTIRFGKANGTTFQSVPLVLEKTISTRAAIYSVSSAMPDWTLNTPLAGEYTYAMVGTGLSAGTTEVRIAGAQMAFGQGAQWIERTDFPTTAANAIRLSNLEAAATVTDPVPAILYGEDLWLILGRKQSLHIDNIYEKRTERKGVLTTLISPNPIVSDNAAKPYEQTREDGSFIIDPVDLGATANIWAHRYSDAAGGAGLGRSYRSAPITVHKAAMSGAGTVRVMGIGDSIMSQTLSAYVQAVLTARGNSVTMSGTCGLNEGRPGSTITDHIRARTGYLTPVTSFATYLASDLATKQLADPWTRASTGGDPAGSIYNGRIFDFSYYLAGTGITPPTHVWICLGTNDIGSYDPATAADWIEKGLAIMVPSILAAVPTVKIAIALPTLPRMAAADTRWNDAYGLAIRKILRYKRTLANANVKVLPIWAHINQVTAFASSEVVVSTDADTGMVTLDNGDMLHPSVAGLHQYAEQAAAWVANTFDGT